MSALVISDLHLGVKRSGGTTPQSQAALRDSLQTAFRDLILAHTDKHLAVNGDLFDGFTVDPGDLIRCFNTLVEWSNRSGKMLTLIAGNHDHQPKADKVSSFEILCHFLEVHLEDMIQVVDHTHGFSQIGDRIWAIPHMPNQDLFDLEIQKAIDSGFHGWLLLHANVMSTFAEASDHSLNVSSDQIRALKNFRLAFGHEHQGRTITVGNTIVHVVGNQFPSSVSDCLAKGEAQKDGVKRALVIHDDLGCSEIETWRTEGNFAGIDWQMIPAILETGGMSEKFVRVVGDARSDQVADAVNLVAKLRSKIDAFVVTNNVKIEGAGNMDALTELTFDEIKSFDVLNALLELLSEEEANVVKELLDA